MDSITLQPNNIYLGNCYELIKQIPSKSVDLIYTDIPYEINYGGNGCLSKNLKNFREQMKAEKDNLLNGIDYSILDEFVRVCRYIYIYIWCSKSQIPYLIDYFVNKHKCNYNILVWCKSNPVPFGSSPFLADVEYCLVFSEKGANFNKGYENKSKWFVSPINQTDKRDYMHATIKPIELVERHLRNSTKENDIVLDPFLGSGTTALACKHLNRKYIGIEINEKYYEIAKDRLQGINARGEMNLFDM